MEDPDLLRISQMRRIQRFGWTNFRHETDWLRSFGEDTSADYCGDAV